MRVMRIVAAGLAVILAPALLFAQQASDFVPVDPSVEAAETLPAAPMVMTAYAIVWLVLIGYVWSLRRRQARIELEMAALRARVNDDSGARR